MTPSLATRTLLNDMNQPDTTFLLRVHGRVGVGGMENQADSRRTCFQLKIQSEAKQNACHRKESAATYSWPKGHRATALAIISGCKGQGCCLHGWGLCRFSEGLKMTVALTPILVINSQQRMIIEKWSDCNLFRHLSCRLHEAE